MAVRLLAIRTGRALLPTNISLYVSSTHFCYRLSKPQGLVRLEGLRKLIKIIHLTGPRTRDLPACSIVPVHLRFLSPAFSPVTTAHYAAPSVTCKLLEH
jgi:hypothetical protein